MHILCSIDYYIVNLVFKRLDEEKKNSNASKVNHEREMKVLKNKLVFILIYLEH